MDLLTRLVWRGTQPVPLQPREFRLLEELMRNGDRVVTRTMLIERVWGFHFEPLTNIVETHMSRLRAKLNRGGAPDLIETVRGVGYRIRAGA
jgi:two-component system OmpR family response regulator